MVARDAGPCASCGEPAPSTNAQAIVALFALVFLVSLCLGAGFVWGYVSAPVPEPERVEVQP